MTKFEQIAADILANKEKHIVNRDVKMAATVDKMVDNYEKQLTSKREAFEIGAAVRGSSGKLD